MKKIMLILSFFVLLLTTPFAVAKPQLKDNYLNHPQGTIGTEFVFKVTYVDNTGKEPEYVKIFMDGSPLEMQKISGTPRTGEIYQYSFVGSEENAFYHNYYFEASDGIETVKFFDITTADQTFGGPSILAAELKNNKIYFFSRNSAKPLWEYSIGKDWAINVDVSFDGNTIAAKTSDYIYVFSKDGRLQWKLLTSTGNSDNIDPSGFVEVLGDKIFAGGGGRVYLFNKQSKSPVWKYETVYGIYNIQASSDGKFLAVGRYDDRLDLVDGTNGKVLWHYDVDGGFHALGISSDGKYIIGGTHCPDRTGYLFSEENNKPIWKKYLNDLGSPVWSGTISSNGEYIVFGLDGGGAEVPNIFLFSRNSNEPLWTYASRNWVRSLAISEAGDLIVAGTGGNGLLLFSKDSNVPLWVYKADEKVGAVDISEDGNYIVAGTKSKKLLLFSKDSNVPLWEFDASEWVNWVKLNGEYIVASTGAPQYIFEGHSESIEDSNTNVIVGGSDEMIKVAVCGDGICERNENIDNCPKDCIANTIKEGTKQPQPSYCGNNICEDWTETEDNCPKDCMPPESSDVYIEEEDSIKEEKSLFGKIIDFFKRLFGR